MVCSQRIYGRGIPAAIGLATQRNTPEVVDRCIRIISISHDHQEMSRNSIICCFCWIFAVSGDFQFYAYAVVWCGPHPRLGTKLGQFTGNTAYKLAFLSQPVFSGTRTKLHIHLPSQNWQILSETMWNQLSVSEREIVNPEAVGSIPAKHQKFENSNLHGCELHSPSNKGTKLLFQIIKAIINQSQV